MLFGRFFVCLSLLISIWGCSDAKPEVSFFDKTKAESIPTKKIETIVGSHVATATGLKLKGVARMSDQFVSTSSDGKIVSKSVTR
jgi:hypothetical protein